MSTLALQTETMLDLLSQGPSQILGQPAKRDVGLKPQLPTKRKRDSICGLGSFNKVFTIKPCSGSSYDAPFSFKPIRIIARSQLPLTFLDTSVDENFAPNALFSASIEVLEKNYGLQGDENTAPRVLVARYEFKKTLYAIERVRRQIFSLCKLARWLKEKDVETLWDPSNLKLYPNLPALQHNNYDGGKWWQGATVHIQQGERPVKCVQLAMTRPASEPSELIREFRIPEPTVGQIVDGKPVTTELPEILIEAPSSQQVFETFVQQYLDAVYLSKTSLAYFAKGPIARARAAFTSPEAGTPATYELVALLRTMLLSHKMSDKKYREKLPEIIKKIPLGHYTDDERTELVPKPKKSKKKVKLNRDGIYPQEDVIVKRWWLSELRSSESYGEETMESRVKRRIDDLRVRESLAQMILMLEIIALEALTSYREPPDQGQSAACDTQTEPEGQLKPKKRKKKLDDVKLLLDLLLDKLCIWQTIDQDGILDFDANSSKEVPLTDNLGKAGSSDRLQSFCVEVIVPFYVGRLPEQAVMINKKLGGPAHNSPPKRKAMKPPATSRKSGELKDSAVKHPRRTLGRVATDTTAQATTRRPTPSLNRSNTDSALLHGIKREGSEVPLAAIPFQRSPSNAARQSMSQLKHLKGRQVDFSAPSAAAAAKLKQKKRVEEDLQEAITALKKPNRGLMAGSYVDDIERRGLGVPNHPRKIAHPVRRVIKDVQVSATPRAIRKSKDIVEHTPNYHRNPFFRDDETQNPPSSGFRIPSSAVRSLPLVVPGTTERGTTVQRIAVTGTPSRVPVQKTSSSAGASRRTIFATPVKAAAASPPPHTSVLRVPVFETPVKKVPPAPPVHMASIFSTPLKRTAVAEVPESPFATAPEPSDVPEHQSIYDALGWNDDDDDLY